MCVLLLTGSTMTHDIKYIPNLVTFFMLDVYVDLGQRIYILSLMIIHIF